MLLSGFVICPDLCIASEGTLGIVTGNQSSTSRKEFDKTESASNMSNMIKIHISSLTPQELVEEEVSGTAARRFFGYIKVLYKKEVCKRLNCFKEFF